MPPSPLFSLSFLLSSCDITWEAASCMIDLSCNYDDEIEERVITVSTATLVTLCLGAAFLLCAVAMTWWLCRRRREHTKLSSDKSLAFRPPHRKPTAVKSPGSTSHYLKKSPSPTGPAKSPPGSGGQTPSPTGSQSSNPASQPRTPQSAGNNRNEIIIK